MNSEKNSKNSNEMSWLNKLNLDPDIVNNASDENIAMIKKVTKLILD